MSGPYERYANVEQHQPTFQVLTQGPPSLTNRTPGSSSSPYHVQTVRQDDRGGVNDVGTRRKRNNPGRSVNGCWTCRMKKVKCDEVRPICTRCKKLKRECQPPESFTRPSVKERRKGFGSFKERGSTRWRPAPLLVKPDTTLGFVLIDDSSQASSFDDNISITGSTEESTSFTDETESMPSANIFPETSVIIHESIRAINSRFYYKSGLQQHPFSRLMSGISPALSPYHITLPNSLTLSAPEHCALKHYQTTFAISRTSKDPQWSFVRLLLRMASHDAMTMRLMLAVSLDDLESRRETSTYFSVVALQNFETGAQSMRQLLSCESQCDQLTIMVSFYYIYLFMSRQPNMDPFKINRLSTAILAHIQKQLLDWFPISLYPPFSTSYLPLWKTDIIAEQSFWARLITWIYGLDVSSSFYNCGGSLASFFSLGNKIQGLWHTSKPVLKLNWGPNYPDDEKDSRIYPSIDFLLEVLQLRYEITQQSPDFPSAHDDIGERLNDLEQKYTATFKAAFSCLISPTTDAQVAVDSVLAFYSLRIFHFRSSSQNPFGNTASAQIQNVLSSLISLARWAIAAGNDLVLDHTQWAIFIGCLEATDPSDRDWLYNKIISARSKATLKRIRETQVKAGGIINMSTIRRLDVLKDRN